MSEINYSIRPYTNLLLPPAIVRTTIDDGQDPIEAIVTDPEEAISAGISLDSYTAEYAAYAAAYAESIGTHSDESDFSRRAIHKNMESTVGNFINFMTATWIN